MLPKDYHRSPTDRDSVRFCSAVVRQGLRRGEFGNHQRMLRLLLTVLVAFAPAPIQDGRWSWPVEGAHQILRPFIAPATPYSAGHRGIDIAASGNVYAPADGVVHFAGFVVSRDVLSISHAGGVVSSYEPVASSLHAGDVVTRGEVIGTIEPGHCSIPCLHFGVRIDGQYVSPLLFLGGIPHSVLLPTRPIASSGSGVSALVALFQPLGRNVRVQLRRPEARVAQHLLHRSQVRSPVQEVGCRGVPQGVRPGRTRPGDVRQE